uniref:Uncharacterized protein n=1 Tax=Parascaris equorum TaxID=6256 RepID=A0A914S4L4_PAREQ
MRAPEGGGCTVHDGCILGLHIPLTEYNKSILRLKYFVSARVADLESLVQERVAKARAELESRLRAQIEQEMMREVEQSKKREVRGGRTLIRAESKKRCAELEESLEKKMKEVQENERKLYKYRLAQRAEVVVDLLSSLSY